MISLLNIYPKEVKSLSQISVLFGFCRFFEVQNNQDIAGNNLYINNISKLYVCVHIHTMEYYSALKKKEILLVKKTGINLEDIMLK